MYQLSVATILLCNKLPQNSVMKTMCIYFALESVVWGDLLWMILLISSDHCHTLGGGAGGVTVGLGLTHLVVIWGDHSCLSFKQASLGMFSWSR